MEIKKFKNNNFLITLTLVLNVLVVILFSTSYFSDNESDEEFYCNVLDIKLYGDLYTYIPEEGYIDATDITSSEDIVFQIEDANLDEDIKAIIIQVDSYGGSPVTGEEISNAIKQSDKPVIAVIRGAGLSAAYWAVSSADYIFASKNSDIGSIGVTQSYLDNTVYNSIEGLSFVQLSVGKFKDTGIPDKPLTREERSLLMRDLDIIYNNFMESVSNNRNIPIEKVLEISDGSSVLGDKALEINLIDGIGDYYSAREYIYSLIKEDVFVCEY